MLSKPSEGLLLNIVLYPSCVTKHTTFPSHCNEKEMKLSRLGNYPLVLGEMLLLDANPITPIIAIFQHDWHLIKSKKNIHHLSHFVVINPFYDRCIEIHPATKGCLVSQWGLMFG